MPDRGQHDRARDGARAAAHRTHDRQRELRDALADIIVDTRDR